MSVHYILAAAQCNLSRSLHPRAQSVASTSYSTSCFCGRPAPRLSAYTARALRAQAASSNEFGRKAQDLASDASKSAAEFFEKHRVQERAAEAGKQATQKLKETYEVVEDNVKRAASEVDSKFNVSEKAQQAAYKVREGAESIDTQLGIRRRLRIAAEDAQRKWPLWRKRYNDFIRTPVGRVMFGAFIFWLVYSGLAIRLVQIVFWTMWLAPFFLIPIANKFGRKMQNEMAAQAAAQQAARQRAANPFRSAFFGSRPGPSAGPAGPAGRSRASRYEQADAGPIIDAEWTTIDEGDRK